jgi:hypothetical protein
MEEKNEVIDQYNATNKNAQDFMEIGLEGEKQ